TMRFSSYGGRHLAYSSDGTHIVVGTSSEAIVYDAATGKQLRRISPLRTSTVDSMALSGDGKLLALGTDGRESSVQIFDMATGKFERECKDAARHQCLKVG